MTPRQPIASVQNQFLRTVRRLQNRRGRDQLVKYVLEGLHPLEEALNAGARPEFLLFNSALPESSHLAGLLGQAGLAGIPCLPVESGLFSSLTDTVTSQGVLGVFRRNELSLDRLVKSAAGRVILILDGLQDPGNLGTIIRTAAAAGAGGVILIQGTVDVYNAKVLRSTAGMLFRLPIASNISASEALAAVRLAGFRLLVADAQAPLLCFNASLTGALALVIGNENRGVCPELSSAAVEAVRLPLENGVESLNAAVAAAILLYEAWRQRSRAASAT